jgi:hypothetical protein
MSTLLVNTDGPSFFRSTTNLIDENTEAGKFLKEYSDKLNIKLTDTDSRAILVPRRAVIDVVHDFNWYAGPKAEKDALDIVPSAFITEREQILSSLISGALYYLNNVSNTAQAVGKSELVKSLLGETNKSVKDVIINMGKSIGADLDSFSGIAGGTQSDRDLLKQHNLKSLQGLYFTRPTKFNYRLPIYTNPSTPLGNWTSQPSNALFSGVINKGKEIVDTVETAVNIAQPGVYIEKPKYFQHVQDGREETITFPLANTVRRSNVNPIQQNYELLWLLAFQNSAYKTSYARTPPPKIYTVQVPGRFSMPYAYISNMNVKFLGTIREAKVFVPSGNGTGAISKTSVSTPVPEVYEVSLTFKSLISEYGNTMLSTSFNSKLGPNSATVG